MCTMILDSMHLVSAPRNSVAYFGRVESFALLFVSRFFSSFFFTSFSGIRSAFVDGFQKKKKRVLHANIQFMLFLVILFFLSLLFQPFSNFIPFFRYILICRRKNRKKNNKSVERRNEKSRYNIFAKSI